MTQAILEALNVEDELSALRAIADTSSLLDNILAATGKEKFGDALDSIRRNAVVAKQIADATGKPLAEAVGVILAWKASHDLVVGDEEHPGLQQQLSDAQAAIEARDRAELIEQGKRDKKLTPASAKFWEEMPVAQLRAFLESAPRVIPAVVTQPQDSEGDSPSAGAGATKFEDMTPMERHALLDAVGAEVYEQIKADATERNGGVEPPPRMPGDKPAK